MRILYYDIDTLRPDHLGCYGYHRDTSPNIDRVAKEGWRFNNCFVSDAPCLPSRSAMFNQRFGIHTGIVGHGGTTADKKIQGVDRAFFVPPQEKNFVGALEHAGYHTVSVSPFADRHAAWWFYEGFREIYNTGKKGNETGDEIAPVALDWLDRNGDKDNWFLHVNVWDPHGDYRTPLSFGNPFVDDPPPDWMTDEIIQQQYKSYGPHSAQEPYHLVDHPGTERSPAQIRNLQDYRRWIDAYDVGIRYADYFLGQLLAKLEQLAVLEDTMIIITSDHGENQGELNVYADHQTADVITTKVPMIIKIPGKKQARVLDSYHYQMDLGATIIELAGATVRPHWDSRSLAAGLEAGHVSGRDYLVVSQNAWSCQRGVIFDDYIFIRTYHDGYKDLPEYMVFHRKDDPHQTNNLAPSRPDLVQRGLTLLAQWFDEMMSTSDDGHDPMQTVLREGGPFHTRGTLRSYCQHLEKTGRAHHAASLRRRHPDEFNNS